MEKTKDGNKEAFEKLVLKNRKDAIGFAYSYLKDIYISEDIVQESFASIYINRHSYKPKNTFKTFLFAVIRNRCIDFLRKNKNYTSISLNDIYIESKEPMPYEIVEREETMNHLIKI